MILPNFSLVESNSQVRNLKDAIWFKANNAAIQIRKVMILIMTMPMAISWLLVNIVEDEIPFL